MRALAAVAAASELVADHLLERRLGEEGQPLRQGHAHRYHAAARLLTVCGFRLETKLAGMPAPYGQYAWTLDHGEPPCA